MYFSEIKTYLFQTIYVGKIDLAKALLGCGFDINSRDRYTRTLLMVSCMLHREEFIRLFIERGANIYLKDSNGRGIDHYCKLLTLNHIDYSNSPK